MAPRRAPSPARRVLVGLGILAVAGLLVSSVWPPATPSPPDTPPAVAGPRPAQTHRARAIQDKAQEKKKADATDQDEQPPVTVRILLGPQDRLHRNVYMSFGAYKAHQLLPMADEAPWPDHPASDRLQELLDADADDLDRAERDALAEALIEAADDPALLASPWGTLITFEARKRESQIAWCKLVEDDDCRWRWKQEGDVPPERDHLGLDADARALLDAHPDDAVGDFAALYLLSTTDDGEEGVATALDVLASTPDPMVAAQAASRLMHHGRFGEPLDRAEMDLVAETWTGMDLPQRLPLALMGADFALQRGDLDRAWLWQQRAEAAHAANCDAGHHSCEGYASELPMTRGQIAALARQPPASWVDVLTAAGWDCHETDPLPKGAELTLQGEWADGWTFTGWGDADPAFAACFETAAEASPTPPDQARVTVEIMTWPG